MHRRAACLAWLIVLAAAAPAHATTEFVLTSSTEIWTPVGDVVIFGIPPDEDTTAVVIADEAYRIPMRPNFVIGALALIGIVLLFGGGVVSVYVYRLAAALMRCRGSLAASGGQGGEGGR